MLIRHGNMIGDPMGRKRLVGAIVQSGCSSVVTELSIQAAVKKAHGWNNPALFLNRVFADPAWPEYLRWITPVYTPGRGTYWP